MHFSSLSALKCMKLDTLIMDNHFQFNNVDHYESKGKNS